MNDELKRMKKLAKVMKTCGITHYKTSEIEISIDPRKMFFEERTTASQNVPQESQEESTDPINTLLWSAPEYAEGNH